MTYAALFEHAAPNRTIETDRNVFDLDLIRTIIGLNPGFDHSRFPSIQYKASFRGRREILNPAYQAFLEVRLRGFQMGVTLPDEMNGATPAQFLAEQSRSAADDAFSAAQNHVIPPYNLCAISIPSDEDVMASIDQKDAGISDPAVTAKLRIAYDHCIVFCAAHGLPIPADNKSYRAGFSKLREDIASWRLAHFLPNYLFPNVPNNEIWQTVHDAYAYRHFSQGHNFNRFLEEARRIGDFRDPYRHPRSCFRRIDKDIDATFHTVYKEIGSPYPRIPKGTPDSALADLAKILVRVRSFDRNSFFLDRDAGPAMQDSVDFLTSTFEPQRLVEFPPPWDAFSLKPDSETDRLFKEFLLAHTKYAFIGAMVMRHDIPLPLLTRAAHRMFENVVEAVLEEVDHNKIALSASHSQFNSFRLFSLALKESQEWLELEFEARVDEAVTH